MSKERKDLGEALRRRAERAGLTPADLGEVQRRARRIRRRRTSLAVAGAAASVAVVAGIGFALGSGGGDHTSPIGPSDRSPAPAPLHRMSPGPARSLGVNPAHTNAAPSATNVKVFRVDVTPRNVGDTYNGSPGVPMWQDDQHGTIIAADGTPTKVGERVRKFVQSAPGQWSGLIQDPGTGGWAWTTYDANGRQPTFRAPGADSVAVTPDGRSVAWMWWPQDTGRTADSPTSWTLSLSGPHHREWQVGTGELSVAGILADGDVVFNDDGVAKVARQDGRVTDLGSYRAVAVSTATGAIAVQRGGCAAIVDENGTTGPDECGMELSDFSADGSLLLAHPASGGQSQIRTLTIMRADTLSAVAIFQAPPGGLFDPDLAWSDHSVVVPVYGAGGWSVAWLSEGGVKIARSSGRPGSPSASPYLFGAGPLTAQH